jgi:hypothetical protein
MRKQTREQLLRRTFVWYWIFIVGCIIVTIDPDPFGNWAAIYFWGAGWMAGRGWALARV